MPVAPTYPGVYIDELPSGVRTIIGVPTAVAAFVGAAERGTPDRVTHIDSWGDFERNFGGLSASSAMSYAVYHFYQNGGSAAEIVRVVGANGAAATVPLDGGPTLTAISAGAWGNELRARVDYAGFPDNETSRWNLTIRDVDRGIQERYTDITTGADSENPLSKVLTSSRLVAWEGVDDTKRPTPPSEKVTFGDPFIDPPEPPAGGGGNGGGNGGGGGGGAPPPAKRYNGATPDSGKDGDALTSAAFLGGAQGQSEKKGLYALLDADIFNLLVVKGYADGDEAEVLQAALQLCVEERAILLVDKAAPWTTVDDAFNGISAIPLAGDPAKNAAVYFPDLCLSDPLKDGNSWFGPIGSVAGVIARTDAQRGVWKAPAGTDASIAGVQGTRIKLTDADSGRLNPKGLNCIRTFPFIGTVVWGARTLRGADILADQWKYLPVRRTALFIEESLYRGTQWAVFEPNDEPLWASLRLNIGAFMNDLYRQGAFAGASPREAYLVKCDKENNPQNDVDKGIVNILVGFAPLKPAEFVIIHIQQLAGQLET
jgi:phage tail sheath protein FI